MIHDRQFQTREETTSKHAALLEKICGYIDAYNRYETEALELSQARGAFSCLTLLKDKEGIPDSDETMTHLLKDDEKL